MTRPQRLEQLILLLLAFAARTIAFSFTFTSPPTQCAQTTIQWTGDVKFPLRFLAVPVGHLVPETRVIIDKTIDSSNTSSYTFPLTLPADSQFVAILSDANGIGTGGTSAVTTIAKSSDSSCISTTPSKADFVIFTNTETPSQCDNLHISWESQAVPPVTIIGAVPGGNSFIITNSTSGTSVDFTVDIASGTPFLLVAGDANGLGKGGSTDVVKIGSGGSSSCLNDQSPRVTDGPAAGSVSTANPVPAPTQSSGQGQPGNGDQTGSQGSSPTAAPGNGNNGGSNQGGSNQGSNSGSGSNNSGGGSNSGNSNGGSGNGGNSGGSGGNTGMNGGTPGSDGGQVTGAADPNGSGGSNTGVIVGGVIGGLAALVALLAALLFIRRRRKAAAASRAPSDYEPGYSDTDMLRGPGPHTWFTRGAGAHLRGGASESVDTLNSMFHPQPFILPPSSADSRPYFPARLSSARTLVAGIPTGASAPTTPMTEHPYGGMVERKGQMASAPRRVPVPSPFIPPEETRTISDVARHGHEEISDRAISSEDHARSAPNTDPEDPFADGSEEVHVPPTYASLRRTSRQNRSRSRRT